MRLDRKNIATLKDVHANEASRNVISQAASQRDSNGGTLRSLHDRALACARKYLKAEAELLDILIQIDSARAYLELGYSSLFTYAVSALTLGESQAYAFITVARKSREVPALQRAVEQGALSVGKAKRIVPVIQASNSEEWIVKAQQLPQRELERQVASLNPLPRVRERVRPLSGTRSELRLEISAEFESEIHRLRDVLSQQQGKACSLEDVFRSAVRAHLKRMDPLARAKRLEKRKERKQRHPRPSLKPKECFKTPSPAPQGPRKQAGDKANKRVQRTRVPAHIIHQVSLRDQNRCTYAGEKQRCESRRWLHLHHKLPIALGGFNTVENLHTLCSAHHRMVHERWQNETLRQKPDF